MMKNELSEIAYNPPTNHTNSLQHQHFSSKCFLLWPVRSAAFGAIALTQGFSAIRLLPDLGDRLGNPAYLDVEYLEGIHVVDSVLWLDAARETDLGFLSHALADPIRPHHKILLTKTTAALLRRGKRKTKTLICPYQRRFTLGDLDIELFPSGFMPGSAQILLSRSANRLVYTGPFRLDGIGPGNIPVLECDTLVLRAEYARAEDQPDYLAHEKTIITWAKHHLDSGIFPVLFTKTIGPAIRLCQLMSLSGIPTKLHTSLYRLTRKIDEMKACQTKVRRFNSRAKELCAVILPLSARSTKALLRLKRIAVGRVHTHPLTQPKIHPQANPGYETETRFFLPMHAKYEQQVQYVRSSKAQKIHVTGSAAYAFAAKLRDWDFNAWPLRPPVQLSLFASLTASSTPIGWSV